MGERYCCHLGPDGEECPEPAGRQIWSPPFRAENCTEMCERHAPEYTSEGDWVLKIPEETG